MPSGTSVISLNRSRYAVAAVVMQVLLGVLYSWSVFRGPLAQLHGWTKSQTIAPYRYSLVAFAAGMILAGFWQDRKGPRVVASVGGLLLGSGCLLASWIGGTVGGLILAYGVVAGCGVGFAYVTPIATCIKWYPDKRGMIVGLAVMGFGVGPLAFGPLLEALIGKDPAQFDVTIPRTFLILAFLLYVGVIGTAQFYRVPPPGWKPEGWNPPPARAGAMEIPPRAMVATWQFYALWLLYFLGTSVGLTAIGEAARRCGPVGGRGSWRHEHFQWRGTARLGKPLGPRRAQARCAGYVLRLRGCVPRIPPPGDRILDAAGRFVPGRLRLRRIPGVDAFLHRRLLRPEKSGRQLRTALHGLGRLRICRAWILRIPAGPRARGGRSGGRLPGGVPHTGRSGGGRGAGGGHAAALTRTGW
jgi:MFS family permease